MRERTPLVVVGDALLDRDLWGDAHRLAPDAPVPVVEQCEERTRPGGAALTALLAAREGRRVTLITALGDDAASHRLRGLLPADVTVVPLPLDGELPQKTRIFARGKPLVRLDQGEGRAREGGTEAAVTAIAGARALLVADYGRGTANVLRDPLARAARHTPLVWDPHQRGLPPVPGTRLATPTAQEAEAFVRSLRGQRYSPPGKRDGPPAKREGTGGLRATAQAAGLLTEAWDTASLAVTLGARGALLTQAGSPLLVPAPEQHEGDSCGAGDQFSATAAGLLADGALPEEAVRAAVLAATAYVADGGATALNYPSQEASQARPSTEPPAATPSPAPISDRASTGAGATPVPHWPDDTDTAPELLTKEAERVASRVREAGGTVVATGGCFDLLHAGHTGLLQAARRTGDCLIVCINSDASVRRRKGADRPINALEDRVRVLLALECVDAVAVFEEDTPLRLLDRLRPHLWAKGGDYALSDLPEAAQLEKWGGQALLLPYLDGHSTSRLAVRMQNGGG